MYDVGIPPCNIMRLINVIYAWVILVFGSSFVRITLHYFAIYAHISQIMLGFGLIVFLIPDLHISSQVLGEKHEDQAKPSQESLQKRPNRPQMDDPRQNPQNKTCTKMQSSGINRARLPEAAQPGRGHHHGLTVVVTFSLGCFGSFAAFRFPTRFLGLCCYFIL